MFRFAIPYLSGFRTLLGWPAGVRGKPNLVKGSHFLMLGVRWSLDSRPGLNYVRSLITWYMGSRKNQPYFASSKLGSYYSIKSSNFERFSRHLTSRKDWTIGQFWIWTGPWCTAHLVILHNYVVHIWRRYTFIMIYTHIVLVSRQNSIQSSGYKARLLIYICIYIYIYDLNISS